MPKAHHPTALVHLLLAALCACQPTPSPATRSHAPNQHLVLCDGASVSLYDLPTDFAAASAIKPQPLLKLDANTHCPQWMPHSAQAILATHLVTGRTKMDEVRGRAHLRWFDAHTRQIEDFVTLNELDAAFVPIWQDQAKPRLAVLSLRDADPRCLTQTTAFLAREICGNVHAEAFYLEPEGTLNQLTQLPEAACKLLPSPNGIWLAVLYGTCGGLRQNLQLVRLDTGEAIQVPIDLSIYGVDDISWQPNSAAIAILARRQSHSVMVSRVMRQQFNDILLYELANQRVVPLITGLVQLQFLSWLHQSDDTMLYAEGGVVWQQRLNESRSKLVARVASLSQPPMRMCHPSFSLSHDDVLLAWQESCDGMAAHTGWLNLHTGQLGFFDAMRNYKGVIRLSPNHAWIASITAERAQGTMLSRASLIHTETGQRIDLGICPPGSRFDWIEMRDP